MSIKSSNRINKLRRIIAAKARDLRTARGLTQADLAARLGLSQLCLSEIERGEGSFTAEQFLLMLGVFNVTASHFAPPDQDRDAQLQNALARLGAAHLHEDDDVAPSERLEEVGEVVRDTLLSEAPRHLTALGPVIVQNLERVNLRKLRADLAGAGLDRRLFWVLDNVLEALRRELRQPLARALAQRYRRAEVVLGMFLFYFVPPLAIDPSRSAGAVPLDLLDVTIGSRKTVLYVAEASSDISKRWGIVTALQPDDFALALRGAHV